MHWNNNFLNFVLANLPAFIADKFGAIWALLISFSGQFMRTFTFTAHKCPMARVSTRDHQKSSCPKGSPLVSFFIWSPLVRGHLFQPSSMYCLNTPVSDMWVIIMLFFMTPIQRAKRRGYPQRGRRSNKKNCWTLNLVTGL